MNTRRVVRTTFLAAAICSAVFSHVPSFARPGAAVPPPHPTAAQHPVPAVDDGAFIGRVFSLVEQYYVEPDRVELTAFVTAALISLEKNYPEIIVDLRSDGREAVLRVGGEETSIDLSGLENFASAAAVLESALEFSTGRIGDVDPGAPRYTALREGLRTLDPHTQLFDRKQMNNFQTTTRGSFGGVGFSFSLSETGILVSEILPATPAAKVGLLAGDVITAVDGSPTAGITTEEAVGLVRGDPGTAVVLTVSRDSWSEARELTPTRAVIRSRSVRAETFTGEGEAPVDYIRIERFQGETSMQIQEALDGASDGAAGIILDLRGNPGGLLDQAVSSTDIFLDSGVIVSTRDRSGRSRAYKASMFGVVRNQLPMIVLINRASASAAEVMSAALKETRAVVVGEKSFGKGSVQQMYPLPDGGGLLLTIRHYFTPGEVSIQSRGVEPDVLLRGIVIGEKMIIGEPVAHAREGSLKNAFDPRGSAQRGTEPEWKIEYLREGLPGMGRHGTSGSGEAGGLVETDAAVRVATAILRQAASAEGGDGRSGLLAAAETVFDRVSDRERGKIISALEKRGIDWAGSNAGPYGKPLLEAELPTEIILDGGEKTAVTILVRNVGEKPAYRVWGRTASANPILSNHDFVFGTVPPGESREATVEMAGPARGWQRWDTYELALREGAGGEAGNFRGGARSTPRARTGLSYSISLTDENGEDRKKNGDGVLSEGEHLSVKISVSGNEGPGPLELRVSSEAEGGVRLDRRRETLDLSGKHREATFRALLIEAGEADHLELNLLFRTPGTGTVLEDRIVVPLGSAYRASEERRPPQVVALEPPPEKTVSGRLVLKLNVTDETSVKDVYVLLAGKKVLYRRGGDADPASLPVALELDLADGSNRIDVIARDGDNLVTEKSFFVFRLPLEG